MTELENYIQSFFGAEKAADRPGLAFSGKDLSGNLSWWMKGK
jgi:hypothetical protein